MPPPDAPRDPLLERRQIHERAYALIQDVSDSDETDGPLRERAQALLMDICTGCWAFAVEDGLCDACHKETP